MTVPVAGVPPSTISGAMASERIVPWPALGGFRVSSVVMTFADVAVIVATSAVPTGEVVTAKVPCVSPSGMMSDEGTVALPLLLASVTSTPPEPAALDSVTVPVAPLPDSTGFGAMLKLPIVP